MTGGARPACVDPRFAKTADVAYHRVLCPMPAAIQVRRNAVADRYEADADGRLAVAEYVMEGGCMVFTHTYVPPELRGRGVAEALVRAALTDAQRQGLRVGARCPYVVAFIRRHPEFRQLVTT